MQVLVPLAGPDFISTNGTIKGLIPYRGKPIIYQTLSNRPWSKTVNHYSFILKDSPQSRDFFNNFLLRDFPNSSAIFLSSFSQGAALSALAGISLIRNHSEPLIVDLADIVYTSNVEIYDIFARDSCLGGIALAFTSNKPCYSYFKFNEYGKLILTAEKCVISSYASVGTYVFRDSSTFLRSLAYALESSSSDFIFNDLYYVSLLFNGILMQNKEVNLQLVSQVQDIKVDCT